METKIANENEKTLEVDTELLSNEWKSCCFKADKDFLKFFVQVAISFVILALSIYKLCIITGNSEDKSLYVSLLTLILGIYTPQPTIKNNNRI
jgi:hypothetical protein